MTLNLPKLIGHRGLKDLAPENTIDSIKQAIKFGLKWIEVDVKISKDKIPFLLHDEKLDRTTSGKGSPIKLKYQEIAKLNAGINFKEKKIDFYPPTLKEVLSLCEKKNIGINIELKPNKGFEQENVKAVVKLLKSFNFKCKYFFSSFDFHSIILLKNFLPYSYVSFLIDRIESAEKINIILNNCKKQNFFACGFNIKIINKEIINICQKNNLIVTVYSSQNIRIEEAKYLWKLGVNSIFIDNPKNYENYI